MAEGKSKTGVVKKRASKREKKDWIAAYIFIAPVTLGLLVFYIWPFIQNIWFSFNEVSKFNVCNFLRPGKLPEIIPRWRSIEDIRKYIEVRCGYGSGWIVLINPDRNSSELQD